MFTGVMSRVAAALAATTVEPIMLIDGACSNAMLILMENVQMIKICRSTFGYSEEICYNLQDYEEENVAVQKELSMFTFYNNIILSVVSLLFILFMGAWSDVYGRKFPLILTFLCQVISVVGYLLVYIMPIVPLEFVYLISFVMSLGGGNTGLMSIAFSYCSDISTEENRTFKISTINSLWYLGGPAGTALIAVILRHSTYTVALSLMLGLYTFATLYIIFIIKESNGPFAVIGNSVNGKAEANDTKKIAKEDITMSQMMIAFINWRRVVESFQSLFRRRDGYDRAMILIAVFCNMARRAARSFFIYMFTISVLNWDATEYSYWTTYKILVIAIASLFLVPLLTKYGKASDYVLVIIGSVSSALEFTGYGLVLNPSYTSIMWVAPCLGMLTNAQIGLRSFPTKIVGPDEKGRITAATGALTSLMPMVGYALYTVIYYNTVTHFPGAQFLFGGAINFAIAAIFLAIYISVKLRRKAVDIEKQIHISSDTEGPVRSISPLKRLFSNPIQASSNKTNLTVVVAKTLRNSKSLCLSCSAPKIRSSSTDDKSLTEVPLSDCQCGSKGKKSTLFASYSSPMTDEEIKRSES